MDEIAREKLCPKCLEQKTKMRWFNEAPEHNHVCPNYLYELKRPTMVGDMEREFGWWVKYRVRSRTRSLMKRFRDLEEADSWEREGSNRSLRNLTRKLELQDQLQELERSLLS